VGGSISGWDLYAAAQVQSTTLPDLVWAIVEINPMTGSSREVRQVTLVSQTYLQADNSVLDGRYLFLLDSNFSLSTG